MYRVKLIFYSIISLLLFQNCSITKYIPEGDSLYDGATIEITSGEKDSYLKRLDGNLQEIIKPKPNKRIFGFPYKLAIYNTFYTEKDKGIKANIRKKFGEPPVLYSTVNPGFIKEVLNAEVFNKGFFHSIVTYQIQEKDKKTKVTYLVNTGPSYKVRKYRIATFDSTINTIIAGAPSKPLIRLQRRYSLERMREERVRVDKELKDQGYYFFNGDYLEFIVDSSNQSKDVYIKLDLKEGVAEKALRRYTMSKVLVVMDSTAYYDSTLVKRDTLLVEDVHLNISRDFNEKSIARYVFLKEGEFYSRENHQLTLNRLMGMGLFRFVNMQIDEADSSKLKAYIILAPLPKKSLSAEVEAVTKSNNFVGPRARTIYSNRNLLKGGERLTVNFHGSVETQINGRYRGLFTYEFGPQVQLNIPRFILPFRVKLAKLYTPNTIFSADYNYTKRVGYFLMNSFRFAYLYKWKETVAKDHEFSPLNITYFTIRDISQEFAQLLNRDISLKRRYEDQMITSITYSYTYNEQSLQIKTNQLYFNGTAELAGNVMSLLSRGFGGVNEDGRQTFAGIVFAQYARFSADFRHYHHINRKSQFVSRIMLGWGLPYGNSDALPYIRSFFAGGANSVRAFTVNSLGPGSYRLPDTLQRAYFIQQGGDIKVEANLEYRFPIVSVVKGAFFVDAGNTWLTNPNSAVPGAEFSWKKAPEEIAAGAGAGIRLDLNFFIIRLDVAKPIRKPWLDKNKWVLGDFKLEDKSWREENIIFNIAIGYPF